MDYQIVEDTPNTVLVQHLENIDYLYGPLTPDEAWEHERIRIIWLASKYEDIERAKRGFLGTLKSYTHEEVLAAAEEGRGWPQELGLVNRAPK
jgi:hypothetical protein